MLNFVRGSELDLADAREQRAYLRRVIGVALMAVAFIGLVALLAVKHAHAAPHVSSAQECSLVADMVLMAAALRKNEVAAEKRAAVMEDAYAEALGGGEANKWRELMVAAVRFAARKEVQGIAPMDLASAVAQSCQMGRGNLDPMFGTES
ncbi:MAG: hypothetical protein EPO20_14815 [Betaproteobacteria bacterium]|nr:MAG: hypothetical protein EPO20_14815 [Betaproteobacteria bacterium]